VVERSWCPGPSPSGAGPATGPPPSPSPPAKGGRRVLVTVDPVATREALTSYAREHGVSELAIPRSIVVDRAPLLGTGKTDFRSAQAITEERLADRGVRGG